MGTEQGRAKDSGAIVLRQQFPLLAAYVGPRTPPVVDAPTIEQPAPLVGALVSAVSPSS